LFDWQPAGAMALWQKAASLDPSFTIPLRNLAQAYAHQTNDNASAVAIMDLEAATVQHDEYPTHFAELDRLYQAAGTPVEKRLAIMELNQATVVKKDESLAALIALKTFAGKADEAVSLLEGRTFSLWEGGTQFSTGDLWADAHLVRGLQEFRAKEFRAALIDFNEALNPPKNLRAEEVSSARRAESGYWRGVTFAAWGETPLAEKSWNEVVALPAPSDQRGGGSRRRNSEGRYLQQYYQALAHEKLGDTNDARETFQELVKAGEAQIDTSSNADDAAPVRQTDSSRTRTAAAHYVTGLGYAGLGEADKARKEFAAALESQPDHLGAKLALEQLDTP
jgi:tetratricopeptide (TPR) repeat protein